MQWSVSGKGSLWLGRSPSLDPSSLLVMKDAGCLYRCPCWDDGAWHEVGCWPPLNLLCVVLTPTNLQNSVRWGALLWANMADMWKESDAEAERSMALLKWACSAHILGYQQEGSTGASQDPRWQAAGTMSQWWVHKRWWVVLWLPPTPGHECN